MIDFETIVIEIDHPKIQYNDNHCPGCGGFIMYVWRKCDTTTEQDKYVPVCLDPKTTGCVC